MATPARRERLVRLSLCVDRNDWAILQKHAEQISEALELDRPVSAASLMRKAIANYVKMLGKNADNP